MYSTAGITFQKGTKSMTEYNINMNDNCYEKNLYFDMSIKTDSADLIRAIKASIKKNDAIGCPDYHCPVADFPF